MSDRFRWLYSLLKNHFVSLAEMGNGEDGWKWRRRLLTWEEE